MINRRSFLQSLAALAGSSTLLRLPSDPFDELTESSARLKAIGLQLYTVRSEMEKSVERTLARVAKIGYKEVEFAGYFGRAPQQILDLLRKSGLTAPSAHVDMKQPWDKILADAQVIGHKYVVCPWIDESQRTPDAIKRLAEDFNQKGEAAKKAGIQFAYHNHDFEFKPLGAGGMLYDVLLEQTDPALVQMEMDLFWVRHGGADPLAYWKRYPGRFPMVHVKDMKADRSMTDVGSGKIPFATYFRARELGGVKHFFVEHDEPKNAFGSVTHSYSHLRKLTF